VSGDWYQCPRESRALHFEYYRAAKKSAFALGEARSKRFSGRNRVSTPSRAIINNIATASDDARLHRSKREMQEIPTVQAFLAIRIRASRTHSTLATNIIERRSNGRKRRLHAR
jgi:hypothetical protein